MQTAVIVSGVVRNMKEASSSWKFNGDYFLIADENLYKRRTIEPYAKFSEYFTPIINETKVDFSLISIISRNNIATDDCYYHNPVVNMLWKWKCAYHTIFPYNSKKQYSKFLIIRPDLYVKILNDFECIDNFIVKNNTIHTMEDTHTVLRNENSVKWMNDIFLMFNNDVFFKISQMYDFYMENYTEIHEKEYDIHAFLGEYFKDNNVNVVGGLSEYIDFIILNDNVCNDMFNNGYLKNEYTPTDIWKHIEKNGI